MKPQPYSVESKNSSSHSDPEENPDCVTRTKVFPPRASTEYSKLSGFPEGVADSQPKRLFGSQIVSGEVVSNSGPHESRTFPPTPGSKEASKGNHRASSVPSVSAFHTASSGAATSTSFTIVRFSRVSFASRMISPRTNFSSAAAFTPEGKRPPPPHRPGRAPPNAPLPRSFFSPAARSLQYSIPSSSPARPPRAPAPSEKLSTPARRQLHPTQASLRGS